MMARMFFSCLDGTFFDGRTDGDSYWGVSGITPELPAYPHRDVRIIE